MLSRICCAALFLVVEAAQGAAVESVDELLQKASVAVQESNYKGRYTYEAGGALETLEIVHGIQNGKERERVYHLNGVKREFVRDGRRSDCVSTGNFLLRGGLISAGGSSVSLVQNYHLYIRGAERIAGRDAAVIQAVPKDEFRYGVMMAIDKESYLPLMSLTTNSSKNVLERYQAVEISVGNIDLDAELQARDTAHSTIDGAKLPCAKPDVNSISWHPTWVPAGFVVSHADSTGSMGESLTYTDGIASFTLFVKPSSLQDTAKQGAARRGATTAFLGVTGRQSAQFSVVLIGEVPVATAQQIVASVRSLDTH